MQKYGLQRKISSCQESKSHWAASVVSREKYTIELFQCQFCWFTVFVVSSTSPYFFPLHLPSLPSCMSPRFCPVICFFAVFRRCHSPPNPADPSRSRIATTTRKWDSVFRSQPLALKCRLLWISLSSQPCQIIFLCLLVCSHVSSGTRKSASLPKINRHSPKKT